MADLSYTVEVKGVEDLERFEKGMENLTGALNASKGAGKSLEELRKIMVGMKGSSSVLQELKSAVQGLNTAADGLSGSIARELKDLSKVISREFQSLRDQMTVIGKEQAQGLAKGIEEGTPAAVAAVKRQGKTIAAEARRQATLAYEAMVQGNPNAKLTDKGLAALFDMQQAGAQISGFHKNLLKVWKTSNDTTLSLIKLDTKKLMAEAAAASTASMRSAMQGAMGSYSLLSSGKGVSVRNVDIDMMFPSKADYAAALEKRRKELNEVAKQAKALWQQTAPTGSYSDLKTGALKHIPNAMVDMVFPSKAEFETALAQRKAALQESAKKIKAIFAQTVPGASFSDLKTGKLTHVPNAMVDMMFPSKAEYTAALEKRKAELQAAARAASRSAMPTQRMSRLDAQDATYAAGMSQMREYYESMEKAQQKAPPLGKALRSLNKDMGDTHSMARGLASGFNLLWLTWGNLAPLFIGAAISNGFMKMAKEGMQVAHSLQTIASLGVESGTVLSSVQHQVALLSDELIRLGNTGIYGVTEIAEAMQILSLAGLKTNEILAVTGSTLNLAIAGTTDIKTAADVLVSVTTAFGTGAAGFREASDVMVRAAAESKASIESIGEAMKTASVVGEQYGATLQDTAALVSMLANLGIQGTAAGTAVRNMFVDMSERTPKVAKALKQLNLEFRDSTGAMKPLLENIQNLDDALKKLDGKSAKNALMTIFSERGGKAAIAALAEYRKAIEDTDGSTQKWSRTNNGLTEVLRKIEESYGDAAIAAAEMSQSTQNSFKAVGATLETSMYKAFQAMEPQLYVFSVRLREALGSPAMIQALTVLGSSLASLAELLAQNAKWVGLFLAAWGGAKILGMVATSLAGVVTRVGTLAKTLKEGGGLIATLKSMWEGFRTVGAVAATGAGALSLWAGRVAVLLRLIPGIGTALTIASGAWMVYNFLTGESSKKIDAWELKQGEVLKKMTEEADHLKKVNDARVDGLSAIEAEIRLKEQAANDEIAGEAAKARARASFATTDALARQSTAQRELADYQAKTKNSSATGTDRAILQREGQRLFDNLNRENKAVAAARAEEKRIGDTALENERKTAEAKKRLRDETARSRELDRKQRAAELAAEKQMLKDLGLNGSGGTFGGPGDNPEFAGRAHRITEEAKAQASLNKMIQEYSRISEGLSYDKLLTSEKALIELQEKKADLLKVVKSATVLNQLADVNAAIAIQQKVVEQEKENVALRDSIKLANEATKVAADRQDQLYDEIASLKKRNRLTADQNSLPLSVGNIDLSAGQEIQNLQIRAERLRMMASNMVEVTAKQQLLTEATLVDEKANQLQISAFQALDTARRQVHTTMLDQETALLNNIRVMGLEGAERDNLLIDLEYEAKLRKELAAIEHNPAYAGDRNIFAREQAKTEAIITNKGQRELEKAVKSAERLQAALDPKGVKNYGREINNAFTRAAKAVTDLAKGVKAYVELNKDSEAQEKRIKENLKGEEQTNELGKLKLEQTKAQLGAWSDMTAAAASFFSEESKGYKTLMAVSQAFHTAQMAMTMAQQVQSAVLAVLGQAQGDPYSAFVRMAAMIAFVGSLGVALSGSGGGAGAGGKAGGGYQGIKKGGTGTVMGMEGEQSESLKNSIELLADNSKIELVYTQKMLSEMTKMREGIQGIAGTASQDFFIRGFAGAAFGDSFLDSGIGFMPGQSVADIIEKGIQGMGFNLIFDKGAQAMWRELDKNFTEGIGTILGNVAEVVFSAAEALGLNDAGVAERMLSLIPTLGDTSTYGMNGIFMQGGGLVSFKDMSGKEIRDELEAIFSSVGDQMAMAALPMLKDWQRIGEGAFETLTRLTVGIESANYEMEKLGYTAIDYTQIIRKQGDVQTEIMRQTLMSVEAEQAMYRYGSAGTVVSGPTPQTGVSKILEMFTGSADELLSLYAALKDVRDLLKNINADWMMLSATMVRGAGGIENLQSGLETYFDKFFTENERRVADTARLREEFARINVAMPSSMQSFRQLVEGLDLTTDRGQYLFGQLMGVADAFSDVADSIKNVTDTRTSLEIEILRAQGNEIEAVAREREIELQALRDLDPSLVALQTTLYGLEDAATAASKAAEVTAKRTELELEILRASGREAEAVAIERAKEVEALRLLDPSLIGLQTELWALQDAANAAKGSVADTVNTLEEAFKKAAGLAGQFLTPGEMQARAAIRIQETLAGAGVQMGLDQILGTTRQQFADAFKAMMQTGDELGMKTLLSVADDFLTISKSTMDLLRGQQEEVQKSVSGLKDAAVALSKVKSGALALSKSIGVSLGRPDTAENDLWEVINGSGSLEEQLAAAQELKPLIEQNGSKQLAAIRTQLESSEKWLSHAKDILSYVQSLKTGSLSALTPAEKMGEAARHYTETLAKARAGEEDAMSALQSAANDYLSIAKDYSPDAYGGIFNSVTANLSEFGNSLLSQYEGEVKRQQALIELAEASNGLTAEQLVKMQSLDDAVKRIYEQSSVRLITTEAQLSAEVVRLSAIESLIEAAQDPWSYLPGMATATDTLANAMSAASVTWESMPQDIAAAMLPVIGIPNYAEEESARLLALALERLEAMQQTMVDAGLYQAQVMQGVGNQIAQATMDAQDLANRSNNSTVAIV